MARHSRPPGFDMTYKPERRMAFGPPLRQRWVSIVYLAVAVVATAIIVYGQHAPSSSIFFHYIVEEDHKRLIPASVFAIILMTSAGAAMLREQMRGVVVHPDGIEMRELLSLGWPKVRRLAWSQIDRVSVPSETGNDARQARGEGKRSIRLDLWDGTAAFLPEVAKASELGIVLERVALARAIPIEGGTGLVDDMGNPLDE